MKNYYIFFFFTLCGCHAVLSQNQPQFQKKSYVDSAGRFYQQVSLPTYIMVATSPDETPTVLQPTNATGQKLEKKTIQLDGHGVHNIQHHNGYTGQYEMFQIYADGIAPVTGISFSAVPHHFAGNTHYYGKNLAVTLAATDEMSGLKSVYHSVNGQEYSLYSPADFNKEGAYEYKYFATDNVGNAEIPKINRFVLDLSAPKTYHNFVNISGQNVISVNSTIYLTKADSLSGVAQTFYKFDNEPYKPYYGGNIPFQYLSDEEHTIAYYSTDNVKNIEEPQTFTFYLDKTAPITSADVLGDRFVVGNKVYFSGRTKLKLTAVDNKAGVKDLMYSVDNKPYESYKDPFYLPGKSGYHTVLFYATDNMQNATARDAYVHSVGIIYVDLTGPALNKQYAGPVFQKGDTTYISPQTRISFIATDPESGLKEVTYSLDGQSDEVPYKQPFTVQQQGVHKINYFGYDNVSNRNIAEMLFSVDAHAPEIFYNFSTPAIAGTDASDDIKIYPSYAGLYLGATDNETGTQSIVYSINDGSLVNYNNSAIKGFKKNKEYVIKVIATDLLGNQSTQEIKFKTGKY
jgi:hypothetical protein